MDKSLKKDLKAIDEILSFCVGTTKTNSITISEFMGLDIDLVDWYLHYLVEKGLIQGEYDSKNIMQVTITSSGIAFFLDNKSFLRDRKRDEIRYAKEWFDAYVARWITTSLFLIAAATLLINYINQGNNKTINYQCNCCGQNNGYDGNLIPKDTVMPNVVADTIK